MMAENLKHAPRPWEENGQGLIFGQATGDEDEAPFVADCCSEPLFGPTPREKMNAFLIAAAPDLLVELKKQLEWLRHIKPQVQAPASVMMGFDQSIKYITALIAKATGGAQ